MDNVVQIVNDRFACPQCHASGRWLRAARAMLRDNSSIHRLRCTQCGERIVAKASRGKRTSDADRTGLRDEYATLRALESAFPQDGQYSTLVPLDYLEASGLGVMLTRLFDGDGLLRHARTLDLTALESVFRRTGAWLHKLHDADGEQRPPRTLGVAEKLDDLERTYGAVLRTRVHTRDACGLLARLAPDLEQLQLRAVRLHGDCKPENVLCTATRCVGLDVHWRIIAAPVYDLAPFVNHLWLAGVGARGALAQHRCAVAEQGLLAGYGDAGDIRTLRWAQLYFALCHWGAYRQRSGMATIYARWKLRPLVQRIVSQLQGAS